MRRPLLVYPLLLLLAAPGCGDPEGATQRGLHTIDETLELRAKGEIRQLRAEVVQHHGRHGEWPEAWSDIQRTGLDPWGNPYEFEIEGSRAIVLSAGPDGQIDTGDDIHAE